VKTFGQEQERLDPVSERAGDYFERKRFGNWRETDESELAAWLAESFLHRAAYLRLVGAAGYTDHLAAVHTFKVDGIARALDKRNWQRWLIFPALAAASIALIGIYAVPLIRSMLQPPDRYFATDVGGRTLVKFADGTEIELNTDTAMRFRMTSSERTVWLNKGEAWFHVAHDAAHPFNVIVGNHRVTDLGTEFLIRRGANNMEVALLSGRAMLNTEGTPTTMLAPGDRALATPVSVSVTYESPEELADELSWRQGVLVFRRTKLADVVREFNRYNTTKLVVADPSIDDIEITAEIKTNRFDDLLKLMHAVLNLRAEREGNDILISRQEQGSVKKAVSAKHSL
jgi:transmembrane sensor